MASTGNVDICCQDPDCILKYRPGGPSSGTNSGQPRFFGVLPGPDRELVDRLFGDPRRSNHGAPKGIQDLPEKVLDKVFSYLPFKVVGEIRLVSRHWNTVCSGSLNSSFELLQKELQQRHESYKLPKRKTARRNHPLFKEFCVVDDLYGELEDLQDAFGKHIEWKECCFFAGEILDEVYRILRYVGVTPSSRLPLALTSNYSYLSSTALEYFKYEIEPSLPNTKHFRSGRLVRIQVPPPKTVHLIPAQIEPAQDLPYEWSLHEETFMSVRAELSIESPRSWFDDSVLMFVCLLLLLLFAVVLLCNLIIRVQNVELQLASVKLSSVCYL